MNIRRTTLLASIVLLGGMLGGCANMDAPLDYLGDADLEYYRDQVTGIEYSDTQQTTPDEVKFSRAPRLLDDLSDADLRDMPLAEVIHLALQNSQTSIIRSANQFLNPFSSLLANPNAAASIYDPAIQESGILFGQRGVEAALADFDAIFTSTMIWGRDERIQNNPLFGLNFGQERVDETGVFTSQIQKNFADSSIFTINHNWNYSLNNLPSQLFPSTYVGMLELEYRRPLFAGAGAEFTRIAGPIGRNLRGVSGVGQGLLIARINNDISIADFQANIRNMLKDVEDTYWDLYLTYRAYDAEIVARNSALHTWRRVRAKAKVGLGGGSAAELAQAEDNYFESRARANNALADILAFETRLRRLLGMPVNDGKVIRPKDEPVTAEFVPDWNMALAEGLTRRLELRRQKWNIKSLELQLTAAKSLNRPRLDFVTRYRLNGFGDSLFANDDNDGITQRGLGSAYETLFQGSQTGWEMGIELSMPFGFRTASSQIRNYELRLAKARAGLGAIEIDISHEISNAFQSLRRAYKTAQDNLNRRRSALKRVQAYEAQLEAGNIQSIDLLLRAQTSLAAAEIAYFQSIVDYNKAIAEIHYRKGTLLEMNNVHLEEGLWEPDAYLEALRRAWARSHAYDAKALHSEPPEFVDPYQGVMPKPLMPEHYPVRPKTDNPLEEKPANEVPPPPTARPKSAETNPFDVNPFDVNRQETPSIRPRAIPYDARDAVEFAPSATQVAPQVHRIPQEAWQTPPQRSARPLPNVSDESSEFDEFFNRRGDVNRNEKDDVNPFLPPRYAE